MNCEKMTVRYECGRSGYHINDYRFASQEGITGMSGARNMSGVVARNLSG